MSACLSILISIVSSCIWLYCLLQLLRWPDIASSFVFALPFFLLDFGLIVIRSLSLGRIGDMSLYGLLALAVLLASLSYIALPIRLPAEPSAGLFCLCVPSISIGLIPFVLFVIFTDGVANRGGELNWLLFRLPISDGPGVIYTGFSGQYGFARCLTFASSMRVVSFLYSGQVGDQELCFP